MKTILVYLALLLGISLAACDKVDKLLTFYIEDEQTIEIPSQFSNGFPLGTLIPLSPVAVNTNSESEFSNNDTRADLVKDVTLDKLKLTLTDPNQNFDFLKDIDIYISNDANEELRIAYYNDIPLGQNAIDLTSTDAKLDKYIKASSYKIITKARLRKAIADDIAIKASMRFKVTADPL
ncbi:hypothetical protein I5M27_09690 [Adhaeribacter sp. BT258]|uniref:DUF1735 domain-containing protein n=1 Tax=Adhaeribacter terrigena TaxID=2793070 RepID=A0ABS1C1I5_9BACT|nr:hypothetical protein [Adhaeribacter terrigena]MBK0403257.1 hypothetical protein [Adhaeribacter terrigena]